MQLERIQRYEGEESVKEEVILELEKEYDTTKRLLSELEASEEAKRRREIQTLRRFGVNDANMRYSLPDIEISFATTDTVDEVTENPQLIDSDEEEEEEYSIDHKNKRSLSWKGLGWLTGSPLFRRRSGSESSQNRKYRTISADVVALPSTTVQNLRRLYTGRSEFYDVDEVPVKESAIKTKMKIPEEVDEPPTVSSPIDPRAMAEIDRFESLIKDYFRRKQHKRW